MTAKQYSLGKIGCYRTKLIVDNETEHEMGNSVVVKRLNALHEENVKVKHEFENAMIDYHILIEKNPLDKYYKNAAWALKELYKDLFGDEAYGKFLANYRSRIKEREELLE